MCDKVLPKIQKIPHNLFEKALPGVYSPWSNDIHNDHNLFVILQQLENKFLKYKQLYLN